jgi:hypothetical protein
MAVVEEAVEERGDGRGIAEQLSPVIDRTIRRDRPRMRQPPSRFFLT